MKRQKLLAATLVLLIAAASAAASKPQIGPPGAVAVGAAAFVKTKL